MPSGHVDKNGPERLMKLEMLGMLEKVGWSEVIGPLCNPHRKKKTTM